MNKADVDQKRHSYRFNRFKCLLSYFCFGWIVLDGLYFRPCFFYYYFQVCQCSYGTAGWVLIDTNPRQIKEKRFVVEVKLCLRFRNHLKIFFSLLPYLMPLLNVVLFIFLTVYGQTEMQWMTSYFLTDNKLSKAQGFPSSTSLYSFDLKKRINCKRMKFILLWN